MSFTGGNVSTAYAAIRLRTDLLTQDAARVQQIGAQIQRAFDQPSRGIRGFVANLNGLAARLDLLTAGFAAFGLHAAQNLNAINVQFRTMLGSQQAAQRELAGLRRFADRLRQPYLEVVESARGFLTLTRSTNAELNTLVSLAQRLRVVDPTARTLDTSIALREFASGNITSLVRRFEGLQRERLQQIMDEAAGDTQRALEGLSAYLDEVGATEDALVAMGEEGLYAFGELRSEATELAGVMTTDLLHNAVLPLVGGLSDMLRSIRESNPEAARLVGTLAGLAGLGAGAARAAQFAGIGGPQVNRAIGVGVAVTGGLVAGQAGGQALVDAGAAPDVGQFQGTILDVAARAIATVVTALVAAVGKAGEALTDLHFVFRAVGLRIKEALLDVAEALALFVVRLGSLIARLPGLEGLGGSVAAGSLEFLRRLPGERAGIGRDAAALAQEHDAAMEGARQATEEMTASVAGFVTRLLGGQDAVERFKGAVQETAETAVQAAGSLGSASARLDAFSQEQVDAWTRFQEDVAAIGARFTRQRTAEETRLAQQRGDAMANAQRRRERLNEDFARKERGHQARLDDIREEAHRKALQDSRRFAMERLRQQARHAANLLKAAARLDASAIWEEQQRRKLEQQKQQQTEDEAAGKRQAWLDERLSQEAAAFEREREMREVQLTRLDEDLQRQLAAYDRQHQQRLAQLNAQERAELRERENAFIREFNALATHESQKIAIQQQGQAQAEAALRDWWHRQTRLFSAARVQYSSATQAVAALQQTRRVFGTGGIHRTAGGGYRIGPGGYQQPLSFQHGGRLPFTGLFLGHRDEEVLRADVARRMRAIQGGEIDQVALLRPASEAPGGSRSLSVGAVNVYVDEPGASAEQIAAAVREELMHIWSN